MALKSDQTVTSVSERIEQLNNIDKDIAKLLRSAGLAVQALTNPASNEETSHTALTLEQQKENFKSAAFQYFSLLSSVDVRLRRQIHALEEAEIIMAEPVVKEQPSSLAPPPAFVALGNLPPASGISQGTPSKSVSTGSGLGNLDVAWLNSRNDNVGREMEAELWSEAEDFMRAWEEKKNVKAEQSVLETE